MTWLIRLYPPAWRRRYGRELAELVAAQPASFGTAIERCHEHMHAWKDSEPRIWGRSLRFVYRLLSRQTPPHM